MSVDFSVSWASHGIYLVLQAHSILKAIGAAEWNGASALTVTNTSNCSSENEWTQGKFVSPKEQMDAWIRKRILSWEAAITWIGPTKQTHFDYLADWLNYLATLLKFISSVYCMCVSADPDWADRFVQVWWLCSRAETPEEHGSTHRRTGAPAGAL